MEKDALLEILSHDLKEVDSLIQSAKGNKKLSQAFFKLTHNRIKSIVEELEMLEELSGIEKPANSEISTPELSSDSDSAYTPETDHAAREESEISTKAEDDHTPSAENEPNLTDEKEKSEKTLHSRESEEEKEPITTPKKTDSVLEEETEVTEEVSQPGEELPLEEQPEDEVTEEKNQPSTPPAHEPKKDSKVLGERLNNGKSSFNEQLAKNQTGAARKRSFTSPPISDLKKALGINDRFFFQRELFGNNASLMNQTLDQLNEMGGINDAQNFLLANFNWDPENEAVLRFMELVERRYF